MSADQTQTPELGGITYFSSEPGNSDNGGLDRVRVSGTAHLSLREPDSEGSQYTGSDNGTQHFFGSGFKQLFVNRPLIAKMSIRKGMRSGCQHAIDNPILNHGIISAYAIPFSALVAERLAQDQLRPLHYVTVANSPNELFMNFAMNKGSGIPTCLPGIDELRQLTSIGAGDFDQKAQRDRVADSIDKLSGKSYFETLELKTSQSIASNFFNSFQTSKQVAGSRMDEHVELSYSRKRFTEGVMRNLFEYFQIQTNGARKAMLLNSPPLGQYATGQSLMTTLQNYVTWSASNPSPTSPFTEVCELQIQAAQLSRPRKRS